MARYEQSSTHRCPNCGEDFEPKYDYQKLCWPCFWDSSTGQAYKQRQNSTHAGSNGFWGQHEQNGNGWADQERDRQQRARQEQQQRYQKYQGQSPPKQPKAAASGPLTLEFLRKLLMLCHPDKHGGSELSNNVTRELLKMKEALK